MSDVIATIWDFDKTLIKGYMQDPLFEEYNIDGKAFWAENDARIREIAAQGLAVNADTHYLNQLLLYVRNGRIEGLGNEKLKTYGARQDFYPGVIELFAAIRKLNDDPTYRDNGIQFENYIVSSGLKKIIEGTELCSKGYVRNVWGCEFAETDGVISEVAYSIDNTSKTRAIFEINKGVNVSHDIDVNSAIPEGQRRVQFTNMVYTADGPSDIPAFSVINKNGGATFAVYPKGDAKAMSQVEKMRSEHRVQMYAEADYRTGTTASMWIMSKLREQANRIVGCRRQAFQQIGKGTPANLI